MYQYKSWNQKNNYNSKGENTRNYRTLIINQIQIIHQIIEGSNKNNDANSQNKKPDDIPGTVPLL